MSATHSNYIVEPFSLPGVNERHLDIIFSDIGEVIQKRLEIMENTRLTPFYHNFRRVLQEFSTQLPREGHRAFQEQWLRPGALGADCTPLKFLDAPYWLEGKMRLLWRLGLHRAARLEILDIGMGCGHFNFAAACFGHFASGIDLPSGVSQASQFYSDYRKSLSLSCAPFILRAKQPLPTLPRRVDLVTGLLTNFNGVDARSRWNPDDWRYFIDDVRTNLLKPDGRIFLQVTELLTGKDSWAALTKRCIWRNDAAMQVLIGPAA